MNVGKVAMALFLIGPSLTARAQKADGLLRIGDKPPALEVTPYNTRQALDWSSLRGRVVVIEFWATWCAPCIRNIPHLNKIAEMFRNEPVTFVSVTYETEEMVSNFLKKHPIQTLIGLDSDFATFKSYRAWGIPMTVIVNRRGTIASVLHPDNLTDAVINEVLGGKVPQVEPAKPWPDAKGAEELFRSLRKKGG